MDQKFHDLQLAEIEEREREDEVRIHFCNDKLILITSFIAFVLERA